MEASKAAAPAKKLGLERSWTRASIVAATEALIREQGFAKLTSRMVAARAGLKPPLIHYYFNTMDDLYVEVFRQGAEADLARLNAALESDRPLRALWMVSCDPKSTRFIIEFMALANNNDAIRSEITLYAEKRRRFQADAIARHLAERGETPKIDPLVTAVLMENVARGLVLESALDLSLGHEEVEAFLETCLSDLEARGVAPPENQALLPVKPPRRGR